MNTINEMEKRDIVWVKDGKMMFTEQFRTRLRNDIIAVSMKEKKAPTVKDVKMGVILAILRTGAAHTKQVSQISDVILAMLDTMAKRIEAKKGGER